MCCQIIFYCLHRFSMYFRRAESDGQHIRGSQIDFMVFRNDAAASSLFTAFVWVFMQKYNLNIMSNTTRILCILTWVSPGRTVKRIYCFKPNKYFAHHKSTHWHWQSDGLTHESMCCQKWLRFVIVHYWTHELFRQTTTPWNTAWLVLWCLVSEALKPTMLKKKLCWLQVLST